MPIPEHVEKFRRPLAREEVYTTLQKWIVEGIYHPGETMRDKDLAEALGVSRTPVREALRRLEDEGFVQTSANRWTRVASIDLTEADHLYPIIWSLEILALNLAQDRIGSADLQAMEQANARLLEAIKCNNAIQASGADHDFHQIFIEQAANPELRRLLQRLKVKLRWLEIAYFTHINGASNSINEHVALLKALRAHDVAAATQAVKTNWEGSLKRLKVRHANTEHKE
ncbi:GntR family transcriptional regulator [Ktedonosporobacter rubrisoli]|uniref:GntR family transcriptional regulator n=1 Tax=Ktedonosporobacter rubrisoli TaxID=2509675 RepID=A0A4P6JR62_KTERU|nr:GntR family transcriptional regulator [Ktedonosporobacter rubrisoli]QBD77773.1 GntR family transcriptional regulator [Ktedonosporobacter rubrisoli]